MAASMGLSAAAATDVAATDGFLGLLSFIFLQDNRWKFYINGLGITLIVSLLSVVVGILIGLVVALVRLGAAKKGRRTILSTIADIYVDVIRGTPADDHLFCCIPQ